MIEGRQALVCRAPLDVVLVQIRSVSLLLFSRPSFSWVAQKRRREGHRERLRETAVKHFLLCDEASLVSLDINSIVETCDSERLVDFSYMDVPVGSNSEHVTHTVSRLGHVEDNAFMTCKASRVSSCKRVTRTRPHNATSSIQCF